MPLPKLNTTQLLTFLAPNPCMAARIYKSHELLVATSCHKSSGSLPRTKVAKIEHSCTRNEIILHKRAIGNPCKILSEKITRHAWSNEDQKGKCRRRNTIRKQEMRLGAEGRGKRTREAKRKSSVGKSGWIHTRKQATHLYTQYIVRE